MRGDPAVVELVDSAQWLGIPSIVLGELHAGFQAGPHGQRNDAELQRFLAHPVVEELPVDHNVARVFADIVQALRTKGTPIPTNDVWIAATSADAGATLLAYDRHFAAVDRIGVVLLEPSR